MFMTQGSYVDGNEMVHFIEKASKNIEHKCNLLNRHELSRTQQCELQRFIDQNSHLLSSVSSQGTGDATIWKEDKTAERSRHYYNSYGTPSPTSNRSRKEVKWLDSVVPSATVAAIPRTRSLSSTKSLPNNYLEYWKDNTSNDSENPYNSTTTYSNTMSQYGSTGYLNRDRDSQLRTNSPAVNYQSYGKHMDDYNRYETARSRSRTSQRHRDEEERSRFSGYGDRPGSGVEFMPSKWHGGQIITDPDHLPRSLKPRRLYYSPIGDGVVAADGVELKRVPKDLSPRISVTHTRTLDRGEPGQSGYNVYIKTTTQDLASDYGSEINESGRDSRLTGGFSPGSDSYAPSGVGTGMSYGGRESDYKGGGAEKPGNGGDSGSGKKTIVLGVDEKDYLPPKDYSSELGNNEYPGNQGDYVDGNKGRGGYATGPSKRGTDGYSSVSPNYSYHSPTTPYHHSSAFDPHNTLESTRSDPFAGDYYRGRSQSADPSNGHNNHSDNAFKNGGHSSVGSEFYEMASSRGTRKFDVTKDYLITNPRELIHQYATTTPVTVLEIPETTSRTIKKMYTSTTEETYVPYPPYKGSDTVVHPNNFTRRLRDEGLTASQQEANRHRNPLKSNDPQTMQKIAEISQQTTRAAPSIKEIDYLTEKMMYDLQSGHPTPSQY